MRIKVFINKFKLKVSKYRIEKLREQGAKIGENCEIYKNVSFGSEPYLIEIGNNVRISDGVRLTTHDGGVWVLRNYKNKNDADLFSPIKIGNNVHIGINSIIMPGVEIGDNVIIGAGSIVTKNINNNSIVAGVPAKVINDIDNYYKKNKKRLEYTKFMDQNKKKEYLLKKYNKY